MYRPSGHCDVSFRVCARSLFERPRSSLRRTAGGRRSELAGDRWERRLRLHCQIRCRPHADPLQIHCRSAPVPLPRASASRAGRHDLTRPRNSRLTSTVKRDYPGALNRNIIVISLEAAGISDHGSSRLRRKEMYEFPDRHRP